MNDRIGAFSFASRRSSAVAAASDTSPPTRSGVRRRMFCGTVQSTSCSTLDRPFPLKRGFFDAITASIRATSAGRGPMWRSAKLSTGFLRITDCGWGVLSMLWRVLVCGAVSVRRVTSVSVAKSAK